MGLALTGTCEKEFIKLFNEINNWHANGANKHKLLVQQLCEKVFKKGGYQNQKDGMRNGLTLLEFWVRLGTPNIGTVS